MRYGGPLLATTNLARSKDFYGQLFDWLYAQVQGTDQAVVDVVISNRVPSLSFHKRRVIGGPLLEGEMFRRRT